MLELNYQVGWRQGFDQGRKDGKKAAKRLLGPAAYSSAGSSTELPSSSVATAPVSSARWGNWGASTNASTPAASTAVSTAAASTAAAPTSAAPPADGPPAEVLSRPQNTLCHCGCGIRLLAINRSINYPNYVKGKFDWQRPAQKDHSSFHTFCWEYGCWSELVLVSAECQANAEKNSGWNKSKAKRVWRCSMHKE